MQIDTIKALFTYATATLIIGVGFAFLFFYSPADPSQGSSALLAVTGLMGGAATFLFSGEAATRATRAAATQTAAAVAAVNAPPPAS